MSTGTMPVAALAATLILALPAADAAAGAPSSIEPGTGATAPQQRDPAPLRLVALGDPTLSAARPAKPAMAEAKGMQFAALDQTGVGKPGAKPRTSGPVPRSQAGRHAPPPRPPLRALSQRPTAPAPEVIRMPGAEAPLPRVIEGDGFRTAAAIGPEIQRLPGSAAQPQGRLPVVHGAAARMPHQVGVASYYSRRFDGRLMANGQRFDPHSDTIAHRSLPFGTRVRIVNMSNGRSVLGIVRDRGPYARGRLLDVSPRIAGELGMIHSGLARVAVWHDASDPVEIAEAP